MLQQLIHIILVSAIAIAWGIPGALILKSSLNKEGAWWRSFPGFLAFLFFCGLLCISFISSWLCLFVPLHFFYLVVFTISLVFLLFVFQKKNIHDLFYSQFPKNYKPVWIHWLYIVSGLLLFWELSSLKPVHGDTQIYHLQAIRWLSEYGVVPGIANLYPRLGLGSNWFNLISFFYYPGVKAENFTYMNTALVGWFFIWLFSSWRYHYKDYNKNQNSRVLSIFYFLILTYSFFDWQLFRDASNSTSYDFITNAFIILVFSYFLETIFANRKFDHFSKIVLFFSISIIGFKFSGVFIGFLILYHLLTTGKRFDWLITIGCSLLILFPVLIKNYINTGYPFFPATLAFNTPDWQFPKEMAERFYRYIVLSNKFYNYQWSFIDNFNYSTFNWIPFWIKGILWQHKIIILLALSSVAFLFVRTKILINQAAFRHIILLLLLMIVSWFFTAPDPGRFGYGTLLVSAFITSSILIYRFLPKQLFNPILFTITIITIFYISQKGRPLLKDKQHFIFPIESDVPGYQAIQLNNTELHLPNIINENWDHRCYFTPLPCITQKNPYLQLRGASISEGFRMKPYPDSEFIKNYEY